MVMHRASKTSTGESSQTTANDGHIAESYWSQVRHDTLNVWSLGCFTCGGAVQSLKYLFDLPQMAALVRRQHAKRAVDVVSETSIYRRLHPDSVNCKTSRGPYRFRKLGLRLFERTPSGIEVVLTRDKGRKNFESQPVRGLQIPDEQPGESSSPQRSVCSETWSAGNSR